MKIMRKMCTLVLGTTMLFGNAGYAAEQLNEITDEKVYDVALHEVLDKYYEEAKAERENQANLDYEAGEVLLTFNGRVSDFTIDETLPEEKLKRMRLSGEEEFPEVDDQDYLSHINATTAWEAWNGSGRYYCCGGKQSRRDCRNCIYL